MDQPTSVALFDAKPYDEPFFAAANAPHGFGLRYLEPRLNQATVSLASGSRVVCAFVNDTISAPVIDALLDAGVGLLALRCAGYNQVDLAAAFGRLPVVRVPEYSPHAVAEHAVALLLALNRKTHRAFWRTRDGNFSIAGLMGFDLVGRTAGIVGTGRIGRVTAGILRGFGMTVIASDPYPNAEWAAGAGVEYVGLSELWSRADVISLHCPLTPATHHLLGEATLAAMRPGAIVINTSRGGLVDTTALIEALKSGHLGAAGLDVYEEEHEFFFEDHSTEPLTDDTLARLLMFPNVLVTSHQAFFTADSMTNIAATTLASIAAWCRDEPLEHEICYRCGQAEPCAKRLLGRCWPTAPAAAPKPPPPAPPTR